MRSLSCGRLDRAFMKAVAALATLVLASALPAQGQSAQPLHLLLGGGVAFPNGTSQFSLGTGWQLQGGLELARPAVPAGVRVEAIYNRFAINDPDCIGPCGHERSIAGIVDLTLQPRARGVRAVPYLIAGGGLYHHVVTPAPGESATDFGVNAGVGLRIPGLHAFIEAREHVVRNAPNYLPIVVGIRF